MHLGLLTAPFEDTPLMEVADWAGANGFSAFEVACWPASAGRSGAMPGPPISTWTA
jgi:sugar phosphate isomerase/epimerase